MSTTRYTKRIPLQSIIIDNCLVCQYNDKVGITTAVIQIRTFIRNKVDISILNQIPRIDLGNRKLNNILLAQSLSFGYNELIAKYKPTETGILNPTNLPDLNRYNRILFIVGTDRGIRKVNQTRIIKRELLENSAKICMNPNRISRLIESGEISIDNIETLYDL